MISPGKYDAEVAKVMEATNAAGVILVVIGGDKGQGFACQATPEVTLMLPTMLRTIADQLEADTMTTAMSDFKAWLKPDD